MFALAALGHGAGPPLSWGPSVSASPSLGQAPAMEIREQNGKVFPSREFPPGTAEPSRQGISPSSFSFLSSSSPSFSCSPSSSSMSPKVAHLPQGNPPLCLPELPAHTLSAGILPAGSESPSWEAFWSCPVFLFVGADGSQQCLCPGSYGGTGSFWGEGCVCFGRQRGVQLPQPEPPIPATDPLPLPAEAPVSGPLDTGMGPCLELAAPLHPRRRGHGPGALAGPPEPGPRAGREVTRGDKASACLGTGAGCCLPLLCSSHGVRQGRALSAGSGIPDRPDNSRSSRLLLKELGAL